MKLKPAYQNFFKKSEEGVKFIVELERMREQAHAEVENNPERAQYYAGKAKALKEVLNHIEVTTL